MSRSAFLTLLTVLTVTHTLGTVIVFTLPAVSPIAARDYGVPVYMIGYQASLIALGIIAAHIFGGNLSLRWGATRVNQAGLSLMAAGAALLTVPSIVTLIPASVSIGIGYGAMTPSASHVRAVYGPGTHGARYDGATRTTCDGPRARAPNETRAPAIPGRCLLHLHGFRPAGTRSDRAVATSDRQAVQTPPRLR